MLAHRLVQHTSWYTLFHHKKPYYANPIRSNVIKAVTDGKSAKSYKYKDYPDIPDLLALKREIFKVTSIRDPTIPNLDSVLSRISLYSYDYKYEYSYETIWEQDFEKLHSWWNFLLQKNLEL